MESEELFSSEEENCGKKVLSSCGLRPRCKRFNYAQIACLKAHHANGMTRTSKRFIHMIEKAAADTGLSIKQVKV